MEYKKLKKILLIISSISQLGTLLAQAPTTDEQLQQKYWTYKQRFLKQFMCYDLGVNGNGLPINNVNTFTKGGISLPGGTDYAEYNAQGVITRRGVIKTGDEVEQSSMYLSTLALEYRMLKNEGKSTKGVLNEIYYLIQALNRLDDKCENFLAGTTGGANRNGFLMRSDADQQLVGFFNAEYPNTQDKNDNIRGIESGAHSITGDAVTGDLKKNTMSKDHVMDIFKGFMFVKKFVDNELVQPTSSDAPIYIHNEIIAITNRIMGYIIQNRPLKTLDLDPNLWVDLGLCEDTDIKIEMNYVIWDPINNKPVPRGNNFNIWAYPIALMAKNITGTAWDNTPLIIKVDGTLCTVWDYQVLNANLNLSSSGDLLPGAWIGVGNNINSTFNSAQSLIDGLHGIDIPISIPAFVNNPLITNKEFHIKYDIDQNQLTATFGDIVQLCLSLATMSDTWPQNKIVAAADDRFFYNYDLMYALINNTSTIHDKTFFETILNTAPCQGNYNYNYPNLDVNGNKTWDPIWWHNNRWVHPTDVNLTYNQPSVNPDEQGELNGLDYMFLYTMYRYYFSGSIAGNFSKENSCPCGLQPKIESITDPLQHTLLTSNATITRKFLNYKNIGIYLKEYINTNLEIQVKTLTNKTDLVICNNSVVTISNNGKFINPNTPLISDSVKIVVSNGSTILVDNNGILDIGTNTKVIIQKGANLKATNANAKIVVRNGGKLIIEPEALLELNNGSKLIVEDGGQVIIKTDLSNPNANINGLITYNQGSEIQLKGDNAVLEINGRLHIGNNATFSITYPGSNSGYIKFNRGSVWWDNWAPNNAHISCGNNAKIQLIGKGKTDKLIEICQQNVAIPKNLAMLNITKCQIDFNAAGARLETDRPTAINNTTFKGNYFGSNGYSDTRGLLVFGQPICIITNCDFLNLTTGITGALFYSGTKLSGVKKCYFSCGIGIITYGGGANIINNDFFNCADAIEAVDATANSIVSNNTINSIAYGRAGIGSNGTNVEFDISQNTINNTSFAILSSNANVNLRCNDLQNNDVALIASNNAKVNMSSDLGAGFNNANNCNQFGWFMEAGMFEAINGYNNFKINNSAPCTWVPQSGHGPHIIPGYWDCPTITEGSIINFPNYNSTTNTYELFAEYNFWRPLVSATDAVEDRQNKVRKIDLTDVNYPILDSASIITGNVLTSYNQISCPENGNGIGNLPHKRVHPFDNNSNSSTITTSSFVNKKLQKALQLSITKMDKMQNSNKVNQAADLLTEILTVNYTVPLINPVDKYILEIAYQKLFICVAQLAEWHRDSASTFNPIPVSLQNRFTKLHAICALRAGRKDITEKDYKEISDLILLDKAMIYRIADNRQNALSIVNNIIASSPKASHLKMYQNFNCMWSTELDAVNGVITVDKALEQLTDCKKNYNIIPNRLIGSGARVMNSTIENEITYAQEHSIAVYPNPTNGNLSVAYSLSEFNTVILQVFDLQGKLMNVYDLNPEDKMMAINDLNLDNGMYFYIIKGDNEILMNKKIVVVK